MARRFNMADRKYDVEISTLTRLRTALQLDGRLTAGEVHIGLGSIDNLIELIRKIRNKKSA